MASRKNPPTVMSEKERRRFDDLLDARSGHIDSIDGEYITTEQAEYAVEILERMDPRDARAFLSMSAKRTIYVVDEIVERMKQKLYGGKLIKGRFGKRSNPRSSQLPRWAREVESAYPEILDEALGSSFDPDAWRAYVASGKYDEKMEQFCDLIAEGIFYWMMDNQVDLGISASLVRGSYKGRAHSWVAVEDKGRRWVIDGAHAQFGGERLRFLPTRGYQEKGIEASSDEHWGRTVSDFKRGRRKNPSIIGFRVMQCQGGKCISGANSRISHGMKVGETYQYPGNGMYLTTSRQYAIDHYAHHDENALLAFRFDPAEVTTGSLSDREPEVSVKRATLVAWQVLDEDGVVLRRGGKMPRSSR